MTQKSIRRKKGVFSVTKPVTETHYRAVHSWLRKHFGRAERCEGTECSGKSKVYNWALKHGCDYDFKRENFINLCRGCHARYDMTAETVRKLRETNTGRRWTKSKERAYSRSRQKPVVQFDLAGNRIGRFPSLNAAAASVGVANSNIVANLRGVSMTSGGYVWRFENPEHYKTCKRKRALLSELT